MKYILAAPVTGTLGIEKYKTAIYWRNGILVTDEPEKLGGKDLGPDPYTLLLASLVSCTLVTLRMYFEHNGLEIPGIGVEANMSQRIGSNGTSLSIERKLELETVLDPELKEKLIGVADNCPVSRILKGTITIQTELK